MQLLFSIHFPKIWLMSVVYFSAESFVSHNALVTWQKTDKKICRDCHHAVRNAHVRLDSCFYQHLKQESQKWNEPSTAQGSYKKLIRSVVVEVWISFQLPSSSSTEWFSPGMNFRRCLRTLPLLPLLGRVPNTDEDEFSQLGESELLLLVRLMLRVLVRGRNVPPSSWKKPPFGSVGLNGLESSNTGDMKAASSLSSVMMLRQLLSLEKRCPEWPIGDERDVIESTDRCWALSFRLPGTQTQIPVILMALNHSTSTKTSACWVAKYQNFVKTAFANSFTTQDKTGTHAQPYL